MKELRDDADELLVCPQCHRLFKHIYSLTRHVRVVHQGHRPYPCECGKAFATKEQFTRHQNSKHTLQKPFKCQKGCPRTFASYPAREYHHKVIHDQQKHACPVAWCQKQYSSLTHLKNHLNSHTEYFMALNLAHWMCYYGLYIFN